MPKQRPSFLKRQKEQARRSRAEQKREARAARRRRASADDLPPDSSISDASAGPMESVETNPTEP